MTLLALILSGFAALTVLVALVGPVPLDLLVPIGAIIAALGVWVARGPVSTLLRGLAGFLALWSMAASLAVLAGGMGLVPEWLAPYAPTPASAMLPGLLVGFVALISFLPVVREATRLADPYFQSLDDGVLSVPLLGPVRMRERTIGFLLLFIILLINISQVLMTVLLNQWNNRFYTALQDKQSAVFWAELQYFTVIAVIFMVTAVYELYLTQYLQIRWRRWMTQHFTRRWLDNHVHYRMRFLGEAADNPDQRIADDINMFVDRMLYYVVRFFNALLSLYAFMLILWGLSQSFPYVIAGFDLVTIPGYLVWAALIYAIIGTWVTHLIGKPLVGINFSRQKAEADFRFQLVRTRENGEQIALLDGEAAEQAGLKRRFGALVDVWYDLMHYTKRLTWFTSFYGQASVIYPFIVLSPAYFTGPMKMGGLTQTVGAFSRVQDALSLFVTIYASLADLKAVINRLNGFEASADSAAAPPPQAITRIHGGEGLFMRDVTVGLSDGTVLVRAPDIVISRGEKVLVTGPSGSGKSTLFRAIAGIWPFGSGTISLPQTSEIMLLPQRPYLPVGTLRDVLSYPSEAGRFDDAAMNAALEAARLPKLVGRLDETANWHLSLSTGEQQRLAIARAILHKPDWLFLDEATSAMDEAGEAMLYRLLQTELPQATIVSIGHRSTLVNFHDRRIALTAADDGIFTAANAALLPMAK